MRKQRFNIEKFIVLIITVALVAAVVLSVVGQTANRIPDVSFYQIKHSSVSGNIRIVQLSDLHNNSFGSDNDVLVSQIQSLNPDIIAITGDMTNRYEENNELVVSLCKRLVDIAPVYYSWGNHEYNIMFYNHDYLLKNALVRLGVNIVNNSYEVTEIRGNTLSIGGFCASPEGFNRSNRNFMCDFSQNAPGIKILLCHYPTSYKAISSEFPVDAVFCGHAHGGQIRIPGLGGLYAPNEGLFPSLTEGIHIIGSSQLIISRGLGNTAFIPRINNNAELVVADIHS